MSDTQRTHFEHADPILRVEEMSAALRYYVEVLGFEERGDAVRVASTATHYIELATVLATILPFALHRAIFATTRRERVVRILSTVAIAAGVLATVSRSGILAVAIVLAVLTAFPLLWMASVSFMPRGAASAFPSVGTGEQLGIPMKPEEREAEAEARDEESEVAKAIERYAHGYADCPKG